MGDACSRPTKACGSACGQACERVGLCRRVRIAQRREPRKLDWSCSESGDWSFPETAFNGSYSHTVGKELGIEDLVGAIEDGLGTLQSNKETYEGMFYQSDMVDWPKDQQKYHLVRRTGSGFQITGQGSGDWTFVRGLFAKLPRDVRVRPDRYTDTALAVFRGHQLGIPVCPGRGQGCADLPGLKVIGDADPNDVSQGGVGNCWFLSALSSLAEFDGAVARLFRKTKDWRRMPDDRPNQYTISLTWEEVDIVVDERLCTRPGGAHLLGAHPSIDGELWVPYVEKAFACHCGGWDAIDGGTATHAWRILVGCRDVYTIHKNGGKAPWSCNGSRNANTGDWEPLANSPKETFRGIWPMDWPEVGCDGSLDENVDDQELFERLCEWDEHNFMLAASTGKGSDCHSHDGIVDGHSYSVLRVLSDVAQSGINMIQVRNPWGKQEFQGGDWCDDGPLWQQCPNIKEELQPTKANDGIFWMSEGEFFQYFETIYLCAMDMGGFAL